MSEDSQLLRLYADAGSQAAFTTLVQRYLPLVYSAALRQLGGNLHQAQEVAQTVFTLLARKAPSLHRHPALAGWLYTTTYHAAAKIRRANQRRSHREQEAYAMQESAFTESTLADWAELRPIVDELMLQLKEGDRTAVLLRFFENRSHREIGELLGVTENAARMRVDRAMDSLKAAFARRGIVSSAAALGATLSAQAISAPPAGLGALISSGAITTASSAGLFILMNSTILKIVTLVAAVGSGAAGLVWQHRENRRLEMENRELRTRLSSAHANSSRIPATNQSSSTTVPSLLAQIDELRRSPANSWQERATQLRELVRSLPDLDIPELQLATDEDWLDATKKPLDTVEDYRRAIANLRTIVITRFAQDVREALTQFLAKNGNRFPTDPAQLEPFLRHSIGPAVWKRYVVQPASTMPNLGMGGDWIITLKQALDADYDMKFVIGPFGLGTTGPENPAFERVLGPVMKAYLAANGGRDPTQIDQLLPYATTAEQRAELEKQKRLRGTK